MNKMYNYLFDCIFGLLSCFPACLISNRRLYQCNEAFGRLTWSLGGGEDGSVGCGKEKEAMIR